MRLLCFSPKNSSSGTNDLEGKRNGTIPLSDAEAQNLLNTYSDLEKWYYANPDLTGGMPLLEWIKFWWVKYGIADGRTFESKVKIW